MIDTTAPYSFTLNNHFNNGGEENNLNVSVQHKEDPFIDLKFDCQRALGSQYYRINDDPEYDVGDCPVYNAGDNAYYIRTGNYVIKRGELYVWEINTEDETKPIIDIEKPLAAKSITVSFQNKCNQQVSGGVFGPVLQHNQNILVLGTGVNLIVKLNTTPGAESGSDFVTLSDVYDLTAINFNSRLRGGEIVENGNDIYLASLIQGVNRDGDNSTFLTNFDTNADGNSSSSLIFGMDIIITGGGGGSFLGDWGDHEDNMENNSSGSPPITCDECIAKCCKEYPLDESGSCTDDSKNTCRSGACLGVCGSTSSSSSSSSSGYTCGYTPPQCNGTCPPDEKCIPDGESCMCVISSSSSSSGSTEGKPCDKHNICMGNNYFSDNICIGKTPTSKEGICVSLRRFIGARSFQIPQVLCPANWAFRPTIENWLWLCFPPTTPISRPNKNNNSSSSGSPP